MPEGDTIHAAARRVGDVLVGLEPESIETPQPRHLRDRIPQRLAGRAVRAVDARGKHLFIRFDGGLALHSHLGLRGRWSVLRRGERWPRSARRAWLVVRTAAHEVVQFDGPVLELMTEGRTRFDARIGGLGPDVLAADFDERAFLVRLREDDQSRGIGDALLDQRNAAGIGNVWKSEACYHAGIDPWRPLARISDADAIAALEQARVRMRASLEGRRGPMSVYRRTGHPCPRCGERIRSALQGDDARRTYWCPGCQR